MLADGDTKYIPTSKYIRMNHVKLNMDGDPPNPHKSTTVSSVATLASAPPPSPPPSPPLSACDDLEWSDGVTCACTRYHLHFCTNDFLELNGLCQLCNESAGPHGDECNCPCDGCHPISDPRAAPATRIQSVWRGFASRREEHLSLEEILNYSLFGESSCPDRVPGCTGTCVANPDSYAASLIQNAWRTHRCAKACAPTPISLLLRSHPLFLAASRIQNGWRAYRCTLTVRMQCMSRL